MSRASMRRAGLPFVAACLLAACGDAPPPLAVAPVTTAPPAVSTSALAPTSAIYTQTPDAKFRETAPEAAATAAYQAPLAEDWTLPNGVRVLLIARTDLPIVSARIVIGTGAGELGVAGEATVFASMLEQGTRKHSGPALADAFEALGATHGVGFEWDSGSLFVKAQSAAFADAFALSAETLLQPAFDPGELARVLDRRKIALQQEQNSPMAMASNVASPALFGRAHRYGNSLQGTRTSLAQIDVKSLKKMHAAVLEADLITVCFAGDITRARAESLVVTHFGQLAKRRGPARAARAAALPRPTAERVLVVEKPGAAQTSVVVVDQGISATDPDRDAVDVMNAILGGTFSSRINLNLREQHAYTYGARSRFSQRSSPGPLAISAAVVANKTVPAVREIFHELDAISAAPVSAEELDQAKRGLTLSLPGRFETASDAAAALAEVAVYKYPLTEYRDRLARIQRVTVADVQRVASRLVASSRVKLILVGDPANFSADLPSLGLGAARRYDATGELYVEPPKVAPAATTPPKSAPPKR